MPRTLLEACESLPGERWPARFAARARDAHVELALEPPGTLDRLVAEDGREVVVVCVAADRPASTLRRVRADLLETTFTRPHDLALERGRQSQES